MARDPKNEFSLVERSPDRSFSDRLQSALGRAEAQPEDAAVYADLAGLHALALDPERARADGVDTEAFWAREDELVAARGRVATAISGNYQQLAALAGMSTGAGRLMEQFEADRALDAGEPDLDVGRLEDLVARSRVTEGGEQIDVDPDARDSILLGDTVKGFAAVDAQYRTLMRHPEQYDAASGRGPITSEDDLVQLRAYRRKAARQIVENPVQAFELGMDHPDLRASVLGLGREQTREDAPEPDRRPWRRQHQERRLSDEELLTQFGRADADVQAASLRVQAYRAVAYPERAIQAGRTFNGLAAHVSEITGADRDGGHLTDTRRIGFYEKAHRDVITARQSGDDAAIEAAERNRKEAAHRLAERPSALIAVGRIQRRPESERGGVLADETIDQLKTDLGERAQQERSAGNRQRRPEIPGAGEAMSARDAAIEKRREAADMMAARPSAVMLAGEESGQNEAARKSGLSKGAMARLRGDLGTRAFAGQDQSAQEASYLDFRKRFLERAEQHRDDPVALYGRVNMDMAKSEVLNRDSVGPRHHMERLSHELASEIFQSGRQVGRLAEGHIHLLDKARGEAEAVRQGRGTAAAAIIAARTASAPAADQAHMGGAAGAATEETAQTRRDAENTPQGDALRERYKKCVANNPKELAEFFYEIDHHAQQRGGGVFPVVSRDANGKPIPKDHSNVREGLALPLTPFGGSSGKISQAMATLSGAEVRKLYDNTVEIRNEVSERGRGDQKARKLAHDKLEMGRRALAVEMVKRDLAAPEEIAKQAHRFQSEDDLPKWRQLHPKYRRDPGGAIREGDIKKRTKVLKGIGDGVKKGAAAAGRGAGNVAKQSGGGVRNFVDKALDELI